MASLARIGLAYVRARRSRRWTRERIAAGQRQGILQAVGMRDDGRSLQAILDGLPVTDAGALRRGFAEHNAIGITLAEAHLLAEQEKAGTYRDRRGLSFGLSSGTEGPPGVFITSPAERARYIGTILGKLLAPSQLPGCRVALLLRHDNRLYSDASRTRLVRVRHFDIAVPIAAWVDRLIDYAPAVLIGPASILAALARSDAFERRPLRPRLLLAGAEPLYPSVATYLTEAYATVPRAIYQASEGFIAVACAAGSLHVNEDVLVAEWQRLGADPWRALPVITDFSRTMQRVRRTRLSDVVKLAPVPCPCGSHHTALTAVEGRLSDILYGGGEAGEPRFVFPFVLDAALSGIMGCGNDWQIRQPARDVIEVATARVPSAAEKSRLSAALHQIGGWPAPCWGPLAPRRPEDKVRRFVRLVDPSSEIILGRLLPPSL